MKHFFGLLTLTLSLHTWASNYRVWRGEVHAFKNSFALDCRAEEGRKILGLTVDRERLSLHFRLDGNHFNVLETNLTKHTSRRYSTGGVCHSSRPCLTTLSGTAFFDFRNGDDVNAGLAGRKFKCKFREEAIPQSLGVVNSGRHVPRNEVPVRSNRSRMQASSALRR